VTTGDYHGGVKAVGIKQLKARLSEYVRLAKMGETVMVMERDEVVAELRPARRTPPAADSVEDVLDRLAQSGAVTRAARSKKGWRWSVPGLGMPDGTARSVLDDVRGER
jgi:antitoxin (DNA-binding transcriptional repressor) of toxin-antitoxin stability system